MSNLVLKDEIDQLTDHATDTIFTNAFPRYNSVIFPVSRRVVDPERFSNDSDETMGAVVMGVF